MVYVHFRSLLDPAYESFCHVGETLDCETATTSRFGALLGVPLAVWGLAAYVVMALLAGTRAFLPLAAVAAAAAVALAGISAASLRVLCPLCAVTWVLDLALFVLGLCWRRDAIPLTWKRLAVGGIVGLAIVVAGWMATPRMAPLAAWRSGMHLEHGKDDKGHPWLGAAEPTVVVEEFVDYTCPHCRYAHARLRAEIERKADSVRLVRHDYARMRCPVPHNPATSRICIHARLAYCAGLQGSFWEMSDWLFSRPEAHRRPDVDDAVREMRLDEKRLRACLAWPATYEAAHREYEHAHRSGIRGTPAYVVDGQRRNLAEVIAAVRAAR